MNARSLAIFSVVVAAIVGIAIWFLNSSDAPHVPPEVAKVKAPEVLQKPEPPKPPETKPPAPTVVSKEDPKPVAPTPAPMLSEDDRKIDEVLKAGGDDDAGHTTTAQNLINLLPTLSTDGQVECAQHVMNLLSDEEFQRIMPFWKNSATNPDVIEVLATDLMNREDKVKLPAMLDAAKLPNHPYHEEALSNLEIFLDADHGTDWVKWDASLKDYLKKQAEEENP